jgi:hypothetical protein
MGRARGARPKKPMKAEMPFDWTDALINEVQESTNSTGALMEKYASDPPSPGKSQRERRWAPPTAAARKNRKPRTAAEKFLEAERATCPVAEEASADALSWRLDEWFSTPIGKRVAGSTPQLPLGPYVDEVLAEPIRKRFSRFDAKRLDNLRAIEETNKAIEEWHNTNEEEGAECPLTPVEPIGYEEDAVALLTDEVSCATFVKCTVIGGFTGSKTYTCVFEDKTEERDSCQVAFPAWSDTGETLAALTSALKRRRDAESLLAFAHTISNVPVNEISVTLPVRQSWERLLRIGLSRAPFDSDVVRSEALSALESQYNFGRSALALPPPPPPSDITESDARLAANTVSLCGEVCALYHDAMNAVIFNSDSLNPYHLRAYLARDLPLPPPFQGPPQLGVAANPRDEVQSNKATFRAVWKSTSVSGAPDNSSLSHLAAMARLSWLGRAARNRHRHAIEQASRRWRGGRRGDSARTRRKILISTQVPRQDLPRMPRGRECSSNSSERRPGRQSDATAHDVAPVPADTLHVHGGPGQAHQGHGPLAASRHRESGFVFDVEPIRTAFMKMASSRDAVDATPRRTASSAYDAPRRSAN